MLAALEGSLIALDLDHLGLTFARADAIPSWSWCLDVSPSRAAFFSPVGSTDQLPCPSLGQRLSSAVYRITGKSRADDLVCNRDHGLLLSVDS